MARDPQPDDFVGRTIVAVDTRSCNIWRFSFSDGSSISIEAEVHGGIPVMQVCTECVKPPNEVRKIVELRHWERPIGDPERRDRDFERQPYGRQEQRVAEYLSTIAGIGGGDDPVGFLIASHAFQKHKAGIVRIRLGRENDAALLPAVERSAARLFHTLSGLEWVAESEVLAEATHLNCIRRGTCWVGVDEQDVPIGFLSAEATAERELHIHELSVDQAYQGYGIGRALLGTAIDWATTHHLTALTLTTFRNVPWNAPFYSRVGFEVLGAPDLNERLSTLLRKGVKKGFAEGTRCAMRFSLTAR